MNYIALLRGINVGGHRKVEMKRLKALFESLGCTDVKTYLNTGNVIFTSTRSKESLQKTIPKKISNEFDFEVQTLIKTQQEITKIAKAIPKHWENNTEQKTDVVYLFAELDTKKTIDELPIEKDFIEIKYVRGALIWNVLKKDYNKSRLNKIIGTKLYQSMTVRNVNTARFLATQKKT